MIQLCGREYRLQPPYYNGDQMKAVTFRAVSRKLIVCLVLKRRQPSILMLMVDRVDRVLNGANGRTRSKNY